MCDEIDRFDKDYEEAKNKIKENLSFLKSELDLMAILAWISRLEEPVSCPKKKAIRNEYTRYLAHQLSRQTLHLPFIEDPPEGPLKPFCLNMINPDCAGAECGVDSSNKEQQEIYDPCEMLCFEEEEESLEESQNKTAFSEWPLATSSSFVPRQSSICDKPGPKSPVLLSPPCKKPCEPCPKSARHEKRETMPCHDSIQKCNISIQPCPVPPEPRTIPFGYLSRTSEEDDGPFLPPLPCSEENRSKVDRILAGVTEETELFEFMSDIAPYTCDLGETMQQVISEELANFKEFVKTVYQSRMADTQELLTKEHIKLKNRYDEWESNVLRQAQAALRSLKILLPQFKYDNYKKDPEYLYYLLRNQMVFEDAHQASPQARILRAKAQKKTWINEEAQRIEKDNMDRMIEMRELNAQLAALSNSYNASHRKLTDRNKCLEDQAAQFRIRHDENQKLIDLLIDQLNTLPKNY